LQVYPKEDVMKRRLDLVQETGMVDYAVDLYKEYHHTEDVPRMFLEKRTQVRGLSPAVSVHPKTFEPHVGA
jgi:translation initiation factor 3 subunit E